MFNQKRRFTIDHKGSEFNALYTTQNRRTLTVKKSSLTIFLTCLPLSPTFPFYSIPQDINLPNHFTIEGIIDSQSESRTKTATVPNPSIRNGQVKKRSVTISMIISVRLVPAMFNRQPADIGSSF